MDNDRRSLRRALAQEEPGVWGPALDKLIRTVADEDRLELDRWHAELGPAVGCPSLIRHRRAALRHDWGPKERLHVDTCRRCQRTQENVASALWHPDVDTLVGRLSGGLSADDAAAVEHHLDDDQCQACLRLLRSPWLLGVARRARARPPSPIGVRELRAVACAELPRAVGEFATGTRPPFHLRAVASGGDLVVTLRETDQGQLVVHVEAPTAREDGQTVRVELLGDGDPVVADVEMRAVEGEPGCIGRHAFGPFVDLVPNLRPAVALLAVLAEKGPS